MKNINDIQEEWNDYFIYRKSHIKKLWKAELNERIKRVESLEGEKLEKYLNLLCEAYFDYEMEIPIYHPAIWSKIIKRWEKDILHSDVKQLIWMYKANISTSFHLESFQILEKILELDPNHKEANELLFLDKLDTLDFALHELPRGLLVDKKICIEYINYCESKIKEDVNFSKIRTRFNLDFYYYKNLFFYWEEYQKEKIQEDFFKWIEGKDSKQLYTPINSYYYKK